MYEQPSRTRNTNYSGKNPVLEVAAYNYIVEANFKMTISETMKHVGATSPITTLTNVSPHRSHMKLWTVLSNLRYVMAFLTMPRSDSIFSLPNANSHPQPSFQTYREETCALPT